MRSLAALDQLRRDLRFGIRNLAKNRAFAALAILSLALGIGASTAMYSVIYAVIIDPFPYKDVDASVLGRRFELTGVIRTVIGVMRPRFM